MLRLPRYHPVVTPLLLVILAGIFVLMTVAGGSLNATENEQMLTDWGAQVNALVYQGQWWRLITAPFLHAGIVHILFNAITLFAVGMNLEVAISGRRFLVIYFVAGLGGSVASFAFSPFYDVGVGASGAIFGVIGALLVYLWVNRSLLGRRGRIEFWVLTAIVVVGLAASVIAALPVDNTVHLGGLAVGGMLGWVLCPRYRPSEWTNPTTRQMANANEGYKQWLAAALVAAGIILVFLVMLLLLRSGIVPVPQ